MHMSHFIIWSNSATYFGTPNGQAITQFEQPMQRGLSADCTMPSSVCLMASAGQTCAHVGSSQCMQTIGAVWVLTARSMRSRWMSDWPRWVPHSGAGLHAGLAADAAARVDDEDRAGRRCRSGWPSCRLLRGPGHVHGGDLELGHLRERVDGPDGQLVGGLVARASGTG